MIRTLMAIAALSAAPAAFAQAAPESGPAGVTVQGQPQEAYIIRLDVTGKSETEIRRMVREASWTACWQAPRVGNILQFNTVYMSACRSQANEGAFQQLAALRRERGGAAPTQIALAFVIR